MTAIFVVGATGVLGVETVSRLTADRHEVTALARSEASAQALRKAGARPVWGDLLDSASLLDAVQGATVVIHIATAIPSDPAAPGAWLANDRIRVEGTQNLLQAARKAGTKRYVQQSITRLYGDHGDEWIDESEPLSTEVPPHLRSALVMESLVSAATDIETVILRGGEFYGAGTGTTERLLAAALAGELRLDGTGEHFMSPIHPADMAQAVALAADGTLQPGVFNVIDEEPVRQRDFFATVSELANPDCRILSDDTAPTPPSRRCNARRLQTFGFRATYPNYRIGLEAMAMPEGRP